MMKIKVIADNILNLTDARYFAAYGVDYLVFNLDNINPQEIKSIKEWVEGVEVLLETNTPLTPTILDFIIALSPEGFVSPQKEVLEEVKGQFPEAAYFLRAGEGQLIKIDEENEFPFIKINDFKEPIKELLSSDSIAGIIVEGEPEEKVGFKNFDQLDEIFDLLAV